MGSGGSKTTDSQKNGPKADVLKETDEEPVSIECCLQTEVLAMVTQKIDNPPFFLTSKHFYNHKDLNFEGNALHPSYFRGIRKLFAKLANVPL